jgi:hypothetical protein
MWVPGGDIPIVVFTIGRSSASELASSGALVFTEGQSREPANPQPWLREQWLDPCGCGCGVSSALGIREVAISASGSAPLRE